MIQWTDINEWNLECAQCEMAQCRERRYSSYPTAKPETTTHSIIGKPYKIAVTQLACWSRDPIDGIRPALVHRRDKHTRRRDKQSRQHVVWGDVEIVDAIHVKKSSGQRFGAQESK
jgi:hypothetical protein